jgi:hypothetical protein
VVDVRAVGQSYQQLENQSQQIIVALSRLRPFKVLIERTPKSPATSTRRGEPGRELGMNS